MSLNPPKRKSRVHTSELREFLSTLGLTAKYLEGSNNSIVSVILNCKDNSNTGLAVKEIKHRRKKQSDNNSSSTELAINLQYSLLHSTQCHDLHNECRILSNIPLNANIIQLIHNEVCCFPNSCVIFLPLASCDMFDIFLSNQYTMQCIAVCMVQIARALSCLHYRNIVHTDVKLENILLDSTHYILADFGFAKEVKKYKDRNEFVRVYQARSLRNMPPEIGDCLEDIEFNVEDNIDEKAVDVFALGIAMFQLVFQTLPGDLDNQKDCVPVLGREKQMKEEEEEERQMKVLENQGYDELQRRIQCSIDSEDEEDGMKQMQKKMSQVSKSTGFDLKKLIHVAIVKKKNKTMKQIMKREDSRSNSLEKIKKTITKNRNKKILKVNIGEDNQKIVSSGILDSRINQEECEDKWMISSNNKIMMNASKINEQNGKEQQNQQDQEQLFFSNSTSCGSESKDTELKLQKNEKKNNISLNQVKRRIINGEKIEKETQDDYLGFQEIQDQEYEFEKIISKKENECNLERIIVMEEQQIDYQKNEENEGYSKEFVNGMEVDCLMKEDGELEEDIYQILETRNNSNQLVGQECNRDQDQEFQENMRVISEELKEQQESEQVDDLKLQHCNLSQQWIQGQKNKVQKQTGVDQEYINNRIDNNQNECNNDYKQKQEKMKQRITEDILTFIEGHRDNCSEIFMNAVMEKSRKYQKQVDQEIKREQAGVMEVGELKEDKVKQKNNRFVEETNIVEQINHFSEDYNLKMNGNAQKDGILEEKDQSGKNKNEDLNNSEFSLDEVFFIPESNQVQEQFTDQDDGIDIKNKKQKQFNKNNHNKYPQSLDIFQRGNKTQTFNLMSFPNTTDLDSSKSINLTREKYSSPLNSSFQEEMQLNHQDSNINNQNSINDRCSLKLQQTNQISNSIDNNYQPQSFISNLNLQTKQLSSQPVMEIEQQRHNYEKILSFPNPNDNLPINNNNNYQSSQYVNLPGNSRPYHQSDKIYKWLYIPNQQDKFWQSFQPQLSQLEKLGNSAVQINHLKDLLIRTITPFSYLRLTIEQFLNHPFFNYIPGISKQKIRFNSEIHSQL